jgi:hypothetical protein
MRYIFGGWNDQMAKAAIAKARSEDADCSLTILMWQNPE